LILIALLGPAAAGGVTYATASAPIMGTSIDVTAPEAQIEQASRLTFEVFREVDALASEWKEGSPLTAVNRGAGGAPVAAPAELLGLVQTGLELGEATGGAFDVTWAALWGAWDFKAEAPALPEPADLAARCAKVGWEKVELDAAAGTLRLPEEGMLIGLGGIAKGYALDRAADALRAAGVESFNLSAGGQVLAAGQAHPAGEDARPWRVGIRDPRGPADDFFALVEVSDASISTSGDYERYFEIDGQRYHHILDLRTGQPARGARSATVISTDATLADALSTALMVMGPAGLAVIDEMEGVEAVVVDPKGGVHATGGISERLVYRHPPAP